MPLNLLKSDVVVIALPDSEKFLRNSLVRNSLPSNLELETFNCTRKCLQHISVH